jgi:hypothetical protein
MAQAPNPPLASPAESPEPPRAKRRITVEDDDASV